MKRNLVTFAAVILAPLGAIGQKEQKLFNGKDLSGWEGDPRLWAVVDGVLVGETNGSDKKVSANTFLIWKGGEVGDFDFKMTARVTGGNNSGVQYRSKVLDKAKSSVGGYQMDMHPKQEYLGMLFEERGRGIQCLRGEKVVLEKGAKKAKVTGKLPVPEVDLAKFNTYAISARGNKVMHFINGQQATEIVDNDPEKRLLKGVLALQLHAGAPMKLEVKDIVLRTIESKAAAPRKKEKRQLASWIWRPGAPPTTETVYLRKSFELAENDQAASLTMTCDNGYTVWLNGQKVGEGKEWAQPGTFEVRRQIKKGKNVIAVRGTNEGSMGGLAASLAIKLRSGPNVQIVTDGSWVGTGQETARWEQSDFDDSAWKPVAVQGKMGMNPWGFLFGTGPGVPGEPQEAQDATDQFKVAKDFKLEKLYTVPKAQGSWVSMAVLPDGRLIVCDQYGGLYEIAPPALSDVEATTAAKPLALEIGGAHGLLWHRGALYVAVNERGKGAKKNGIYRVTDSTGDGDLDKIELFKQFGGGGEHGLHSMVPSPDGEWIYFIHGNHANPPEMDHNWMSRKWAEDHLLPRNPDGNGHAAGTMAPGGGILRFRPDGSRWERVSSGFRNPFDLAFNEHGDLFAYDADMEWDLGMPWYRPTRMCHVVPGAEWGWRNGTGKWPVYYEDSLPPVVNIGPGSPTGALSGLGGKFPAKYQKAIFLFDWTFATIQAIHLEDDGSTYKGRKEEFVAGPGLPLTDAEFGKDGAMYFMTGGRRTASALWRVTYIGSESTAPIKRDSAGSPLPELSAELLKAPYEKVIEHLGSSDRFTRFLARVEVERRSMDELKKALKDSNDPWQIIDGVIALARQGAKSDRGIALDWLFRLKWDALDKPKKLALLRAYALTFSRLGAPGETEWKDTIAALDAGFPAGDDELDAELCRVLCFLQAPQVVDRTLVLMAVRKDTKWPDWAELATRNSGYGGAVLSMLRNSPPALDIHYAFCVRNVKGPWTEGQRRQIMEWYASVQSKSGGNSYKKFLARMQGDMLKNATEGERKMVAGWKLPQPKSLFDGIPSPKGPGKTYTVAEVAKIGSDLSQANLENGKKMFKATLCYACHRVGGDGGSAGPDLSAVGGRFTVADIADSLLDPNKVVSDQYQFSILTKKDGSSVWGRVVQEKDGELTVASNAYDFTQTHDLPRSEVKSIKPSPVSPMPAGLINTLNEEELRDLLGYLLNK